MDRTQPVTMGRELLQNRHILLKPYETGSLGASVKQVEIQLRFPPASHARVVSAIANFTPEQNSRRSKIDGKPKLSKNVRDHPGSPGESPKASPRQFSSSKTPVSPEFKRQQIWSSGPSPGTSGASRTPLDLPSRAAQVAPGA